MIFKCKVDQLQEVISYIKNISKYKNNLFPILLLKGELGAGKTTFTSFFVNSFPIKNEVNVNSPTFTLVNEYELRDVTIYHFDLYRIKSKSELFELGFDEIWGKKGISIVEWWERAKEFFDDSAIQIEFNHIDEEHREIKVLN